MTGSRSSEISNGLGQGGGLLSVNSLSLTFCTTSLKMTHHYRVYFGIKWLKAFTPLSILCISIKVHCGRLTLAIYRCGL